MAHLSASHYKFHYRDDGLPYGCTETVTFTRPDMIAVYADAMRTPTEDETLTRLDVYEGEDCVIVEWRYN